MNHKIYFAFTRAGTAVFKARKTVRTAILAALSDRGVNEAAEISVLLTDNPGIRRLNKEFRGEDKATDVLSFPRFELTPGAFNAGNCVKEAGTERIALGDIAISTDMVRIQAKRFGCGRERELAYLTVHSVLHLLGYDHTDESEGKRQMREVEERIMSDLGLRRSAENSTEKT